MKPVLIRALAASGAAFLAAAWPAAALADNGDDCPEEASPPPPPRPPPRPGMPTVVVAAPPRDVATFEERQPNSALIAGGATMFGLSYGASVIIGAVSSEKADQHLFIPVVGPWMDIANRSCPEEGCGPNETANKVLLAASGIFQTAGVLQILGGFLFPEKTTVTRSVSKGIRVTPQVGTHSFGISASGAF